METKKISVKKFVEEYNSSKKDIEQVKKHILSIYVPYEEKCSICQGIIDATMKTKIGNDIIFQQDSPAMLMLYRLQMIDKYTDIKIDFSNVLNDFNLLDEYDLVYLTIDNIQNTERRKMDDIMGMMIKDYRENYRSYFSLWNSIAEKLKFIVRNFTDKMNDIIDEQTADDLKKTLVMHITKK